MPSFRVDDVWMVVSEKQHMLESRCHFQCATRVSGQQGRAQQASSRDATVPVEARMEEAMDISGGTQPTQADGAQQRAAPTTTPRGQGGSGGGGSSSSSSSSTPASARADVVTGPTQKRGKRTDLLTRLVLAPKEGERCDFCKFEALVDFPLPEEVYSRNHVTLRASEGCSLRFDARGALTSVRSVDTEDELMQVAYAKEWKQARRVRADKLTSVKPYDWTYSTLYSGTLEGDWCVEPTEEGIDFQLLSKPEEILYQDHVFLMADDYSDNGIMHMDVRVRAMPSCVYLLQRQFVRVDQVIVRMHDTRVFKRTGSHTLIRECSTHEVDIPQLDKTGGTLPDGRPLHVLCTPTDVNRVMRHFKRTRFERTKLTPRHLLP